MMLLCSTTLAVVDLTQPWPCRKAAKKAPAAGGKSALPAVDGVHSKLVTLRLGARFVFADASVHQPASAPATPPHPASSTNEQHSAASAEHAAAPPQPPPPPPRHSHAAMLSYTPPGATDAVQLPAASTFTAASELSQASLDTQAHCSHASVVHVTEVLARGLAPACAVQLTASCERRLVTDVEGALKEAGEAEALGSFAIAFDIADLLVGDTRTERTLAAAALPAAPAALRSITIAARCLEFVPPPEGAGSPPVTPPATQPAQLLPPGLRSKLAPMVIRFQEAADLPDAPATTRDLESHCRPCHLRYRLPGLPDWQTEAAASGAHAWRPGPPPADAADPPLQLRSLAFGVPRALFAAELDVPRFLAACGHECLEVEVRDREAEPEQLRLRLPTAPPASKPATPPTAVAKGDKKGAVREPALLLLLWLCNCLSPLRD
jgi:hypothetical protein